jgi:hypothetical protein
MPGHVLHRYLCNLYCRCLSQPLLSLSFYVHILHSIIRFLPHLSLTPQIPICCPDCAYALTHAYVHNVVSIFCLDTGFERLSLVRLPCWRYCWTRLSLFFPQSPKTLQSDKFHFFKICLRAQYTKSSRARTDNIINSIPQLYSIDHGKFRVALLVCYPRESKGVGTWDSDSVLVLRRVTLATPYGNPGCLPLSNPTKCRKLGLVYVLAVPRPRAS